MGAIQLGSALFGGSKAKSAAKRAAAEEARLENIVTVAKLQSIDREERALKGQTIGGAAASGVKVDKGSPLAILREQATTFAEERDTVSKAGASRTAQANIRGKNAGNQAFYRGLSQASSAVSNAFSLYGALGGKTYLGKNPGPG